MKITLIKNNITDSETLTRGILVFKSWCQSIGLNVDFTIKETTRIFTSIPYSNNTVLDGYLVNHPEIFQEAKFLGTPFDLALLVYDWKKISPQPTNPARSGLNIQIPMQWYGAFPEVFAEFLLHELSHYYTESNNAIDKTHDYDPAFTSKPRKDWYLHLIKPFLSNEPILPQVLITRTQDDYKQTVGTLIAKCNGLSMTAKTLELGWHGNKPNISCIPSGTYDVKYTFSPRFMKYTYEIQKVPNRSGIRIHSANFFHQLNGCIALGNKHVDVNNDTHLDVINSRATISIFEKFMNKEPFKLTIK